VDPRANLWDRGQHSKLNCSTLLGEELTKQLQVKGNASKTQNKQKRKIIKIRAEISEIETKKTIQRISETKSWFFEKNKQVTKSWQI
jgi:hypothetical protein